MKWMNTNRTSQKLKKKRKQNGRLMEDWRKVNLSLANPK
jgi:hypothetical protein